MPGRLRSPRRAGGGEIASLNFQILASAESVDPTDFCNEIGQERTSIAGSEAFAVYSLHGSIAEMLALRKGIKVE